MEMYTVEKHERKRRREEIWTDGWNCYPLTHHVE